MDRPITQHAVKVWFKVLEKCLAEHNAEHGFMTEIGEPRRNVEASEFMLMHVKYGDDWNDNDVVLNVGFKHRDTRNYVFVLPGRYGRKHILYVPATSEPFMRGYFDTFPLAMELVK